jgi:cytochrome b6-f complex iron-sulfur subunit
LGTGDPTITAVAVNEGVLVAEKGEEPRMSTEQTPQRKQITRREFLYYACLSSIGAFGAASGLATLIYAVPRVKGGVFGGEFVVGRAEDLADGSVTSDREGKFFLVRQGDDFKALYQVCTHLGCLLREADEGFSCPCHGAKFGADGTLLTGPPPRDMDEFAVEVVDGDVIVDTGKRTKGQSRTV